MLSRGSGKCKTDNVESTNVYKSYRIIAEFCMNLTQKLPMPSKGMGSFWVMAAAAPLQQKFRTAMDNDLNTSMAVTVLYDVLKAKTNGATKRYVLTDFDRVLSLDLLENAARKKAEQKQTTPASGGFQIGREHV